MRINLFAHSSTPDPEPSPTAPQPPVLAAPSPPRTGRTFPADEIVWGIVIRSGFDEMDDPWYHRGTTQHAYLEGNDNVSICGFRPPQSGPRTRRRSRLGLPTTGEHPMCGMCARMVVAPRPRVPVLVQPVRPAVAVPVNGGAAHLNGGAAQPIPAASTKPVNVPPRAVKVMAPASIPVAMSQPQAATASTSPWVRRAAGEMEPRQGTSTPLTSSHDSGLLARGIHSDTEI